jgi:uncharacterized membrane protein SirB2
MFCSIIAVPIVESMFRSAHDAASALMVYKVILKIGLLTPIAAGILLLSGTATIITVQYSVFNEKWLLLKLAFFIIMNLLGFLQGKSYRIRGRLVESLALGNAPETAATAVGMLTRKLATFNRLQTSFLCIILLITLFRHYL